MRGCFNPDLEETASTWGMMYGFLGEAGILY